MSREWVITFPPMGRLPAGAETGARGAVDSYAGALLACLAGLTIFRLVAILLSNTELFFDEAQYWFWSRELAFGYYSKPPLIGWIIRGATEICGHGEACIRAPSPLFHAATAMLVYAIGRALYDARIGFWAGLAYATLPGVSLSSSLISTDAPLLFFVALGLLAVVNMRHDGSWLWALALGAAIGFGLLAKYAMSYFLLGLAVYVLWTRQGRALLKDARLYAALALGAALIAPNIVWNAQNDFATLGHTADNANWGRSLVHPAEALEFIGGQFAVFGPILFTAFLVYSWAWLRDPRRRAEAGAAERMLLAFSVPVLVLMTTQAFLSRAHANWAAFAYVAGTVLITAFLLREGRTQLFRASLAIHLAAMVVLGLGGMLAGRAVLPGGSDPFVRVLGWKALADAAAAKAREGGFRAIAADKRAIAAELLYYLREDGLPVVARRDGGPPSDHFELTRPLDATTPRPVLLVGFGRNGPPGSTLVGEAEIPAGPSRSRQVFYHSLAE